MSPDDPKPDIYKLILQEVPGSITKFARIATMRGGDGFVTSDPLIKVLEIDERMRKAG